MIYEKVLAMEAEKIGLDTAQAVIHAMHTLREELLIERVFEEKVLASVEVTAEEIRDEINRAAVSFQFRILPAHSEFDAQRLYASVLEKGYVQVLEERREAFAELSIVDQELTSPLLHAEDIEPVILMLSRTLKSIPHRSLSSTMDTGISSKSSIYSESDCPMWTTSNARQPIVR